MFINYGTQEVIKTVTIDVVKSFNITVTLPVQEVRLIVERNFNHTQQLSSGNVGYAAFNKITAIKEVRALLSANFSYMGLREAKEMVEAVWEEGVEAGNYYHTRPESWSNVGRIDTLPF